MPYADSPLEDIRPASQPSYKGLEGAIVVVSGHAYFCCVAMQSVSLSFPTCVLLQLALSQLRTTCNLLEPAGAAALQPVLSSLLTALKFYMTIGLPGQTNVMSVLAPEASKCVEQALDRFSLSLSHFVPSSLSCKGEERKTYHYYCRPSASTQTVPSSSATTRH